jgi:hypothetical protein
MGLTADIFKAGGRSFSNGGISDHCDEVTIVNIPGPFEPTPERPAVLLVMGNLPGTVKIIPAADISGQPGAAVEYHGKWAPLIPDGKLGPMMGGCYVATSDSRLGEAIAKLLGTRFAPGIAPLHDRTESQAEYDALSV